MYAEGDQLVYCFCFGNECTYFAWIRTSLSLLAAGVALEAIQLTRGGTKLSADKARIIDRRGPARLHAAPLYAATRAAKG